MISDVTEKINEYAYYRHTPGPASCSSDDLTEKCIELNIPDHVEEKNNCYQLKEKNIDKIAPKLNKVKHAIQDLKFIRNIASNRAGWMVIVDEEIEIYGYPENEQIIEKQNKIIKEYNKLKDIFSEKLEEYNKKYGRSERLNMPEVDMDFDNYKNDDSPEIEVCFSIGNTAKIIKRAEPETFFEIFTILQNIYLIAVE